jgi:carboxymethylenebutenolidase
MTKKSISIIIGIIILLGFVPIFCSVTIPSCIEGEECPIIRKCESLWQGVYNAIVAERLGDKDLPPPIAMDVSIGDDILDEEVEYFDGAVGYVARPGDNIRHPGIILIHEWWGLNDNIKDLAKDYAEQGYVALAVDLYGGEVADQSSRARELATAVRGDMEGAFENLRAAVEFLKSHDAVQAEKLASVGWCFGGGWSYQMAKNDLGVKSSVIYYGQFNPEDDLSIMRANILGHFGEEDTSIKVDDVRAFEATLKTLSGDHQIFIYPNAGHAFANDGGSAYVPEATELSWQRTLEFLGRELK